METGCTGGEKCNAVSHSNTPMRKSEADGSTFVYGLHWSYIGKAFHHVISWPVSGLMKGTHIYLWRIHFDIWQN